MRRVQSGLVPDFSSVAASRLVVRVDYLDRNTFTADETNGLEYLSVATTSERSLLLISSWPFSATEVFAMVLWKQANAG